MRRRREPSTRRSYAHVDGGAVSERRSATSFTVASVLTVKFKGYGDDDSAPSGGNRLTLSSARAIAACLEIAEADAHRFRPTNQTPARYAPPTQFADGAERAEWNCLFEHVGDDKAEFAKTAPRRSCRSLVQTSATADVIPSRCAASTSKS